ncbi:MAG TPA: oxygen-independent coproporphyrinogen III oxidase [Thermoanaerobaculia bacterium]|nr:oxygen-independent coproporphyrinogen III oxidase [Thermoanaerobaculia bacterium]HUM30885.1 oxygen-independent coproporphyrinogen III oxidase [Thermoanaerobaculia bacterium]HXK69196.1 oxygen-independent coproporphyrinogen III oxidase [Thermoanaerobaculia bacterium]
METRWQKPEFNFDLILKYDKPGPRYTSYPTAPNFTTAYNSDTHRKTILTSQENDPSRPLSLYVHIPFCRSVCYFCGCNVVYTKHEELTHPYVDLLHREMDEVLKTLDPSRPVVQLHWGGGTPTYLSPDLIRKLMNGIRERFTFADDAEIGIEIDPRECTDEHLRALAECGFNRISMGIQDFDPRVQQAVHRIQSEELTRHTISMCRGLKFESINVDLIYGLPYQNREEFETTVDKIIEIDPDRIAVFNFAYLPEMIKHQRAIEGEAMPSPMEKLRILEMVVEKFTSAGYVFIGMDHFAKPEDELTLALKDRTLYRNFQGYTTKSGADLFAFGVSSISMVGNTYAQNEKELESYQRRIEETGLAVFRGVELTDDDVMRRDLITRLMCHFVLKFDEIEDDYGLDFESTFAPELEDLKPLEADGLIALTDREIRVRPLGRLLVRNIAMPFDAYLRAGSTHKFSRTV